MIRQRWCKVGKGGKGTMGDTGVLPLIYVISGCMCAVCV